MPSPVSDVHCPACGERFYVYRPDFEEYAGAYCHCPFCSHDFEVAAGRPQPPVVPHAAGPEIA